ncbi:MAG: entericidin A/B family lipoprotein [Alphaproteobacteria bacterium]
MASVRSPYATWIVSGLLLGTMLMLSACNTVSGFGRDVESAGDTLSDTADDVQD